MPGPYSGNFSAPASAGIDMGTLEGAPTDDIRGQPRSRYFPDVGASESGDLSGPCAGIDCAGNGLCSTIGAEIGCFCRPGFKNPEGNPLTCVSSNE